MRIVWKEYRFECCVDCAKEFEAAWASNHAAFADGKCVVEVEPDVFMTNLSLSDVRTLARFSWLRHRLPEPLTGYDPSGPAPRDEGRPTSMAQRTIST